MEGEEAVPDGDDFHSWFTSVMGAAADDLASIDALGDGRP